MEHKNCIAREFKGLLGYLDNKNPLKQDLK